MLNKTTKEVFYNYTDPDDLTTFVNFDQSDFGIMKSEHIKNNKEEGVYEVDNVLLIS